MEAQGRSGAGTILSPRTKASPAKIASCHTVATMDQGESRRTAPWYRPTTTLAAQLFGIEGSNNKCSILMVSNGCNLLVHIEVDMILVLRVMKLV